MSEAQAPTVTVTRNGACTVVDIEITAPTPEAARAAFAAFCSSPAVMSADELRRPHATSAGYVLYGRASIAR